MNRRYISDDEYEKLNFHEQMKYKWCPICEHFYLYEKGECCDVNHRLTRKYGERLTK